MGDSAIKPDGDVADGTLAEVRTTDLRAGTHGERDVIRGLLGGHVDLQPPRVDGGEAIEAALEGVGTFFEATAFGRP